MKTEKEIRQAIKDYTNQFKNCAFLFEQTGAANFKELSEETIIFINALKWVLDEYKPEEIVSVIETDTLSVTELK